MNVGFIGIGRMGRYMARRILETGLVIVRGFETQYPDCPPHNLRRSGC